MTAAKYDAEVADRLLEAISDGNSLTKACQDLGLARRTVRQWLGDRPEFKQAHAAAVQMRLETLADEVVDIVDGVAGCENTAVVAAARNRAEARRWLLAKVLPATYGDKVALTGAEGKDLIPPSREARLPQLVSALAVLMPPGTANSELFSVAGRLLDRLETQALPGPGGVS